MSESAQLPSSRALKYWGIQAGGFIDAKGSLIYKVKRGAPGGSSNSGPVGKRHTRFYQGRFGQRAPIRKSR